MDIFENINWQEQKISLKDLSLWDENARFPDKYFNKSEKELIEYFCTNGIFKIENLAKEIVKDFDLPQLEKLITYNADEQLIVLEGNRRLTVYKLLHNPELAPSNTLKNKFQKLKKEINISDNFLFDCLITENKTEGFRFIERKHVNGNNEVNWGEQERTHYNVRRGNATKKEEFKVAIAKIIKDLDIPEGLKDQVLGHGYVTNFWRILDSSVAWKEYGFNLKDDGELEITDSNFKDKLKVIILNVLKKEDFSGNKIDSRSLNTNKEKEEYLKSIQNNDSKKVDKEIQKNTTHNLFGEKSTDIFPKKKKTKINPKSTSRNYLIPKTCRLNINEKKINNIYRELRDNLLIDDTNSSVPNAIGVLFRVFLEINIDYFWEKRKGETFSDNTKLAGKITNISQYMEQEGLSTSRQLKNIRTVATDKNNLLSIQNFHGYVHCYKTQPTLNDLKLKWDNLEEFFEILWSSLTSKK
ncbi:hypothetical protein MS2017_0306 [Bathymodiolus thermophilus thioautotrophic gill symbiont]|uniref:ParB/Sulfiredoxin domain-containing protein n=1 Tax=Bathymodiolus thermophilus thioautotrophic gill symbiont TaxID=2360 RepID=A0A3G3IJP2_9GAMM|nr:hypothetical protein [Bathymodiolus thermophilus thioautotrophic gill symbiont]AYQ56055.1 hypothetical protein MS2017_0306 [Bathymodiolus thermophilus thioautotrophic gill symbiont]